MKKVKTILLGLTFFLLISSTTFVPLKGQTQDNPKKPLSPEQLEMIKQKIKSGEDFIRLEPDTKGSFSWWGYLTYPGQWHFYPVGCGEGNLEIHLTNIPSGSDYDLYLFDCNAVELARSDYGGNSDEEIIYWVSPNTCYRRFPLHSIKKLSFFSTENITKTLNQKKRRVMPC